MSSVDHGLHSVYGSDRLLVGIGIRYFGSHVDGFGKYERGASSDTDLLVLLT